MRKIILAFLLCLVVISTRAATLQGYGDVTSAHCTNADTCIDLLDGYEWDVVGDFATIVGYDWTADFGNGVLVAGDAVWAQELGDFADTSQCVRPVDEGYIEADGEYGCWCRMRYPYRGNWVFYDYDMGEYLMLDSLNVYRQACRDYCSALWRYADCGLVNTDCVTYAFGIIFDSSELELFLSALFEPAPVEKTCEIGICRLMLSTGDAFRLWAEKYTEPSLVVQYNDEKCYVKLESGVGKLNINFNGEIYHAVE